jgi:hypothetical protein
MSVLGFIIALLDLLWSVFLNTYLMEFFVVGCFLLFCLLLGLQTANRQKIPGRREIKMKKTLFITGASVDWAGDGFIFP